MVAFAETVDFAFFFVAFFFFFFFAFDFGRLVFFFFGFLGFFFVLPGRPLIDLPDVVTTELGVVRMKIGAGIAANVT